MDKKIETALIHIWWEYEWSEYDKEGWLPTIFQKLIKDKSTFVAKAVKMAQLAESPKKQVKEMIKPAVSIVQESKRFQKQRKLWSAYTQCSQCRQRHRPKSCPAFDQECLFYK